MGYLISEIIFCLIAAALLGLVLGWLLRGILCRKCDTEEINQRLEACMADNEQLRSRVSTLTEKSGGISNIATANTPADELKQLRAQLDEVTAERDTLISGMELSDTAMVDTELAKRLQAHIDELEAENSRLKATVGGAENLDPSQFAALKSSAGYATAGSSFLDSDGHTAEASATASEEEAKIQELTERLKAREQALKESESQLEELTRIISEREMELDRLRQQPEPTTAATFAAEAGIQADAEKISYDIEEIEGIGAGFGRRLRKEGIETTLDLLHKAATPESREELANKTSIEAFIIRKWVSMADLIRIPGIRGQFAELVEASGVHSVQELAQQNDSALNTTMIAVNASEHRTPVLPTTGMVTQWIEHAKTLDALIDSGPKE